MKSVKARAGKALASETSSFKTKTTLDRRFQVRCSVADELKWLTAATKAGMDLSDWTRRQLSIAAERQPLASTDSHLLDMCKVQELLYTCIYYLQMNFSGHPDASHIAETLNAAQHKLGSTIDRVRRSS